MSAVGGERLSGRTGHPASSAPRLTPSGGADRRSGPGLWGASRGQPVAGPLRRLCRSRSGPRAEGAGGRGRAAPGQELAGRLGRGHRRREQVGRSLGRGEGGRGRGPARCARGSWGKLCPWDEAPSTAPASSGGGFQQKLGVGGGQHRVDPSGWEAARSDSECGEHGGPVCGRCHANARCLLLLVILGPKDKKVTWERGSCLDGREPVPVYAGSGLIFHTHTHQLNLCPVDFRNPHCELCSPRQGDVCLVGFRCRLGVPRGDWEDRTPRHSIGRGPFAGSAGAQQSRGESERPGLSHRPGPVPPARRPSGAALEGRGGPLAARCRAQVPLLASPLLAGVRPVFQTLG